MTTVLPQHLQALERANQIRVTTAGVKRRIAALDRRESADLAADVIEHDAHDPIVGRAHVDELVLAVYRMGPQTMRKCLATAGVANCSRRLCELTARQRTAVAAQLRLWGAGYGS